MIKPKFNNFGDAVFQLAAGTMIISAGTFTPESLKRETIKINKINERLKVEIKKGNEEIRKQKPFKDAANRAFNILHNHNLDIEKLGKEDKKLWYGAIDAISKIC